MPVRRAAAADADSALACVRFEEARPPGVVVGVEKRLEEGELDERTDGTERKAAERVSALRERPRVPCF